MGKSVHHIQEKMNQHIVCSAHNKTISVVHVLKPGLLNPSTDSAMWSTKSCFSSIVQNESKTFKFLQWTNICSIAPTHKMCAQECIHRDWSGGTVVEFACFSSVAQGLPVWIPGVDLHTTFQAILWQAAHIQSRRRWAQMLAQGQSSSAKKRRIGGRY